MKEFHYTSCRTGRSLSGASGFQVRAVSRGMSSVEIAELTNLVRYFLPPGIPETVPPPKAPKRLALVDLNSGSRVLCQTTYVGQDAETERYGVSYFHGLVGVRNEFDVLKAIQTWGSPGWRVVDGDGPVEIDTPPRPIAPGPELTEARLAQATGQFRKEAEFLLRGLMAPGPGRRLFLAAPPEVVAAALYIALSALPQGVRGGITFATYDHEPTIYPTRIAASCWGNDESRDLDDQCYEGMGWGYNRYSGRVSPKLPDPTAFVPFALDALASGKPDLLRAFHDDCTRLKVGDIPGVALLFRLSRDCSPLVADDLRQPVALQFAGSLVSKRDEVVPLVARLAAEDASFLAGEFPAYLAAIGRDPAAKARLVEILSKRGLDAAKGGDLAGLRKAWDDLMPRVAPSFRAGEKALADLIAPDSLALPVRLHLLPRVAAADNGRQNAPFLRWLQARPQELPQFLGSIADEKLVLAVLAQSALAHDPATWPSAALDRLAEDEARAAAVIGEVGRTTPDRAVALFGCLARHDRKADWATALMEATKSSTGAASYPSRLLDACLCDAIEGPGRQPDPRAFLRSHGDRVRSTLADGKAAVLLARMILSGHATAWAKSPELSDYLEWVWNSDVKDRLDLDDRNQLAHQFGIRRFLQDPKLDDVSLQSLATAIRGLPESASPQFWKRAAATIAPASRKWLGSLREIEEARAVEATAAALLATDGEDRCRTALESVLYQLQVLTPGDGPGWAVLYHDLLDRCRKDRGFWKGDGLLTAFLSVGGGRIFNPRLKQQYQKSSYETKKGFAVVLLSIMEKYPKEPAVSVLDDKIRQWVDNREWTKKYLTGLRGEPAPRNEAGAWWKWFTDLLVIVGSALLVIAIYLFYFEDRGRPDPRAATGLDEPERSSSREETPRRSPSPPPRGTVSEP